VIICGINKNINNEYGRYLPIPHFCGPQFLKWIFLILAKKCGGKMRRKRQLVGNIDLLYDEID
jgi:hypothetical protein